MNARRPVLVGILALGILAAAPGPVGAHWWWASNGDAWYGSNPIEPFLIVDALPLDAQVYLDGRLLGTAGDLIARPLRITQGRHAIAVTAPGFAAYTAQFLTDPHGYSTRVGVTLPRQ
jgi:hypothetical protein